MTTRTKQASTGSGRFVLIQRLTIPFGREADETDEILADEETMRAIVEAQRDVENGHVVPGREVRGS